jgi:hypothetical protein
MDQMKVAQIVEVLNGLTARDALCLLVGCIQTVLDEAPSDEERQQSLDGCIDVLKRVPISCTKEARACVGSTTVGGDLASRRLMRSAALAASRSIGTLSNLQRPTTCSGERGHALRRAVRD